MDICEKTPRFVELPDREVACHLYYDHAERPARDSTPTPNS
jgi:hypothetical protein